MAARGLDGGRFDPDEIPWDRIVRVAPVVLLLVLLLPLTWKGFYTVQPHEQAVVLRFGKHHATTGPGLHFMIPLADRAVPVSVEEHRLRLPFGESSEEPPATESRLGQSRGAVDAHRRPQRRGGGMDGAVAGGRPRQVSLPDRQ